MKKTMLLLTAAAVLLAAGGCGSGGFSADAVPEPQTEESIVWSTLYCDVNFWSPPAWELTEGTITGDITRQTGVALETTVPAQDADRRLGKMLVNDELPDLISVVDPTVIGQLTSSRKVWKLDEFLETYCPDSHLLTDFPEDMKQELIKRDGGWYAFPSHINSKDAREIWKPCDPYYVDYVAYNDNNAIVWNRRLLEKLNLSADELSTEKQVWDALEKAKQSESAAGQEEIVPLLIDGADFADSTLKFLQYTFGAEYIDRNGDYKDILLQSESRHALYFLNKAYRKGYVKAEQFAYTNDEVKRHIASDNVLCFIGNIANTGLDGGKWVSSGAILSSENTSPVLEKHRHAGTGWISTFISKSCRNPEKVARFLDYMTGDEGMMRWYYGLEGEDYSFTDDGLVVLTQEQEKLKSDYTETGIDAWWMFENRSWIYSVQKPPEPGSSMALYKELETAYGRDAHTVIYDGTPFLSHTDLLVGDSDLMEKEKAVSALKKDGIMRTVLAGTEMEFLKEYENLTYNLYENGISEIDEGKNLRFQQNQEELRIRLRKINDYR